MSNETPTAPETNAPTTTELQPDAPAAAPADGVVADAEQQAGEDASAQAAAEEKASKNRERIFSLALEILR